MKKRGILIVIVFIILIAGGFAYYNFGKKEVCFEDQCFDVEVAETESERSRGLMYRESLEEDRGMFFVFDESKKHGFWMKNTEIPLDIMWINSEMEVVHIEENVEPCEKMACKIYKSDEDAKYALEINSGLAKKRGISEGDKVETNVV